MAQKTICPNEGTSWYKTVFILSHIEFEILILKLIDVKILLFEKMGWKLLLKFNCQGLTNERQNNLMSQK